MKWEDYGTINTNNIDIEDKCIYCTISYCKVDSKQYNTNNIPNTANNKTNNR